LKEPGFETLCQHAGEEPERFFGAPVPHIFQNSLFTCPDFETFASRGQSRPDRYDYTRCANPTTDILESKIAALERGEAARCFGSGMAAISAAVLNSVKAGEHIVAVDTVYGPTQELLGHVNQYDVSTTFVSGNELADFESALRPETRLIYLESPSTFVFKLQDVAAVAELARSRGIVTVIDNSWASPYFQNPLTLGIDIVVN